MNGEFDVIVIGAGASGLTAATVLARAGFSVAIIEGRDRIGGRIFTLRDQTCDAPVELGAEFIHGRPAEIWNTLKREKIRTTEVEGETWCSQNGELDRCDFFPEVDKILGKMKRRRHDQSFVDFLNDNFPGPPDRQKEAIEWATRYVSGFNAADPSMVGVNWLVKEMRAEEKIDGDRAFRAENGYADMLGILDARAKQSNVAICLNTIVERIDWRARHVEVQARTSASEATYACTRALITAPLGVLQAAAGENGAIRFIPDLPSQKQQAINGIMMGKVIRLTLRFRERFWDSLLIDRSTRTMSKMSFLLSDDDWFPTWWTTSPKKLPFLIGWAPFRCAERLSGQRESFITEQGLRALNRLTKLSVRELESLFERAYVHDWQNDPFSRGAYSYGRVGGGGAEAALAKPIGNTLFFAGEATDLTGNNGTVHGAIASGKRAAREIIAAAVGKKSLARPQSKRKTH
jgi:monoamine oxidase